MQHRAVGLEMRLTQRFCCSSLEVLASDVAFTVLSMLAGDAQAEAIDIFKFPEEVLGTAEAAGLPLPFAVVGSREEEEVEGDIVPLRHYPWGTCLPSRKEHSDAVFFRSAP